MKNILIVSLLMFGFSAMAANVGPAGCGLGHMIFKKDNQVLAATTNDSTYTNMFGITSGTSGCEQKDGVAKLDVYINTNRVALANDMARGQGETLAGISLIMECNNIDQVGGVLKAHYSEVIPSSNVSSDQISSNVQSVLKSNNVQCAGI